LEGGREVVRMSLFVAFVAAASGLVVSMILFWIISRLVGGEIDE
jgi:ABC-type sulfate transport system permease component